MGVYSLLSQQGTCILTCRHKKGLLLFGEGSWLFACLGGGTCKPCFKVDSDTAVVGKGGRAAAVASLRLKL